MSGFAYCIAPCFFSLLHAITHDEVNSKKQNQSVPFSFNFFKFSDSRIKI